jgi:hypothetical protein
MSQQEVSQATTEDDRDPTCSPWTKSGSPPPSLSDEMAVTVHHGWSPPFEDAYHSHHCGPFSGKKAKLAGRTEARRALQLLLLEDYERVGAQCPTTYTTKDMRRQSFVNHVRDHARHAKGHGCFASREPCPGSCTACQGPWTFRFRVNLASSSLPMGPRPTDQPSRSA